MDLYGRFNPREARNLKWQISDFKFEFRRAVMDAAGFKMNRPVDLTIPALLFSLIESVDPSSV